MLNKVVKNPNNPPFPSTVLANVSFLANKMDDLRMQFRTHKLPALKDCDSQMQTILPPKRVYCGYPNCVCTPLLKITKKKTKLCTA